MAAARCGIVALACEPLAWTQMLALMDKPPLGAEAPALRVFAVAGRLVRGGRRFRLRLAEGWL
jgi:hypothetical protein